MLKRVIKFAVTGGLGTITNLTLFFILSDLLYINPNVVSVITFFIACTQNYVLNHVWTFKNKGDGMQSLSFYLWFKFLIGSLAGFAVNIGVLNLLLFLKTDWLLYVIPQAIAILAGMCLNYIISDFFIFK